MIFLWRRMRYLFRRTRLERSGFILDEGLHRSIQELAWRESRLPAEVASEMLTFAIMERQAKEEYRRRWQSLTAREQQVVALICQGYANRQIADWLVVSTETVKSHTRNALRKINVNDKTQLRKIFVNIELDQ